MEVKSILEAMNKFRLNEGFIITLEEERNIKIENKNIFILPVWKWLLN